MVAIIFLCLFSVAVYAHVLAVLPHESSSLGVTGLAWIPLVGSTLAYCCQDLGLLPVIYILLGEQFPTDIRTASVGIVTGLQVGFLQSALLV